MNLPAIKIPKLRQSDLSKCELAIYLRLTNPPSKQTGAMAIGSILHFIAEKFCASEMSIEDGFNIGESRILKYAVDGETDWQNKTIVQWRDKLFAYLKIFLPYAVQFRGKISHSEHRFSLNFRDLELTGTIDTRIISPVAEIPIGIGDWKTSSRPMSQADYNYSPQSFFYIIAAKILWAELMPMTYIVAEYNSGIKIFTVNKTAQELSQYLVELYALRARLQDGIVEKRKGRFCDWCFQKDICKKNNFTVDK